MQNELRQGEPSSNPIILIAEDDTDSREALFAVIEPEFPNYGFLMAANGVDALEAYQKNQNKVVLVLTDNTMPGKTGHELLLDLRKMNGALPIVMISGDNHPSYVRKLKESGLTEFLSKPVETDKLIPLIQQLLSH